MKPNIYFISGIDTDAGKSYCTAWYARELMQRGLMVPLTGEYLTIDYIADKNYPLIFVTSGKLGSINHTLLSLEAIGHRGIMLDTVLYNLYPTVEDKTIQNDTMQYIREYLSRHFPGTKFEVVPEINNLHQTM